MNRRTWGVLLALSLCFLTGCKSQQAADSGLIVDPLDAQKLGFNSRWITDLAIPGGIKYVESLGDVLVTVEDRNNVVTVLAARDGDLMWRRVVGDPQSILSAPVRVDSNIVINSENNLYSLAVDTGQLRAMSNLRSPVADAPAIVGDNAVFGGVAGRVFAHSISAGSERWAYQMPSGILAKPVTVQGNAFIADGIGNYVLLNAADGTLLWRGRTHTRISANPVASGQSFYLASEDQSLYAINRANGRDRWIYRSTSPLTLSPTLLENTIFLPVPGEGLVCIDILNGAELWRLPLHDVQPLLTRGNQILLATKGSLILVDAVTGKITTQAPVERLLTATRGPDNSVILVSTKGRVQRLDPR